MDKKAQARKEERKARRKVERRKEQKVQKAARRREYEAGLRRGFGFNDDLEELPDDWRPGAEVQTEAVPGEVEDRCPECGSAFPEYRRYRSTCGRWACRERRHRRQWREQKRRQRGRSGRSGLPCLR